MVRSYGVSSITLRQFDLQYIFWHLNYMYIGLQLRHSNPFLTCAWEPSRGEHFLRRCSDLNLRQYGVICLIRTFSICDDTNDNPLWWGQIEGIFKITDPNLSKSKTALRFWKFFHCRPILFAYYQNEWWISR